MDTTKASTNWKIAVAVVIPLVFLVAAAIGIFIFIKKRKQANSSSSSTTAKPKKSYSRKKKMTQQQQEQNIIDELNQGPTVDYKHVSDKTNITDLGVSQITDITKTAVTQNDIILQMQ